MRMPGQAVSPTPAVWSIPRGLIVLLAVAAGVVAIAGMKSFSAVIGPTFLALMLTVAVQPLQGWAQQRGWPTWLGMLAALTTVLLILLSLVGALALSAYQLASQLPEYTDKLDELLGYVRNWLGGLGVSSDQIQKALHNIDMGKVVGLIDGLLGGVVGIFSNLFFVVALLLFMAVDGMSIRQRMAVVAQERPAIAHALADFARGTRKYLVVSTVFGAIVAVLDGGALWLMGVPLPLLWALLSFITNYIPNVGFIIGVIPPALLALLDSGPVLMVWVIIVYSVINFVIQSIIQPKFVGDAVGLSVTLTFLSLVFWSWVIGALGAILAVPLTLLVKALLLDIDPSTRWADVLIGAPLRKDELAEDDSDPEEPDPEGATPENAAAGDAAPPGGENGP
ncbi:AI-2E family transporter [Nocardia mangyaensis]|uniref:AI-2E family transporter n=1 Tax=Nocardia mangyaensis TaxID=2213200 RepID=A0A1J0VQ25_9NOCA|nr:AI-2E family transporter [Nocardia mangyaensis]APE34141.1 AI-2E family transporter [Nocardia mangyaensis]